MLRLHDSSEEFLVQEFIVRKAGLDYEQRSLILDELLVRSKMFNSLEMTKKSMNVWRRQDFEDHTYGVGYTEED